MRGHWKFNTYTHTNWSYCPLPDTLSQGLGKGFFYATPVFFYADISVRSVTNCMSDFRCYFWDSNYQLSLTLISWQLVLFATYNKYRFNQLNLHTFLDRLCQLITPKYWTITRVQSSQTKNGIPAITVDILLAWLGTVELCMVCSSIGTFLLMIELPYHIFLSNQKILRFRPWPCFHQV